MRGSSRGTGWALQGFQKSCELAMVLISARFGVNSLARILGGSEIEQQGVLLLFQSVLSRDCYGHEVILILTKPADPQTCPKLYSLLMRAAFVAATVAATAAASCSLGNCKSTDRRSFWCRGRGGRQGLKRISSHVVSPIV